LIFHHPQAQLLWQATWTPDVCDHQHFNALEKKALDLTIKDALDPFTKLTKIIGDYVTYVPS
jgi:hypothetical protein